MFLRWKRQVFRVWCKCALLTFPVHSTKELWVNVLHSGGVQWSTQARRLAWFLRTDEDYINQEITITKSLTLTTGLKLYHSDVSRKNFPFGQSIFKL